MNRRIIIGVIGGDRQVAASEAFGASVARKGHILLTGGRAQAGKDVKDAAMMGAASTEPEGYTARLVGIVPTSVEKWDDTHRHRLILHTGLKHNVRNVINGLTPDVIVLFGGSKGTLAEAAFALSVGKPVFLTCESAEAALVRLKRHLADDFGDGPVSGNIIKEYLEEPVLAYNGAWTSPPSTLQLKTLLTNFFGMKCQSAATPDDLVDACKNVVGCVTGASGFPGLPGDPKSKARFESIVERISE